MPNVIQTAYPMLSEILDVDLLHRHIDAGLVTAREHPTLPLTIYNYTLKAMDGKHWGDGTIDYCRGLIIDEHGFVIARPFKKFHNLNTEGIPETLETNLPTLEPPLITEKMDGSLGILYRYDGVSGIATRGSFSSDQAIWASNWYEKHVSNYAVWGHGVTPLFEIIFDKNRIVCKYDYEGLVLIGLVRNLDGHEVSYAALRDTARRCNVQVVKRYFPTSLENIKQQDEKGREGYVLTYEGGPWNSAFRPALKVKVKFPDYVRIHRVVTSMNPRSIWELMSEGKELSEYKDYPEHFTKWLESWKNKLTAHFSMIYSEASAWYDSRPVYYDDGDARAYRAICAQYFGKANPQLHGLLFAMLDGHDVTPMIWKLVKPRGDDKSFKTEGE